MKRKWLIVLLAAVMALALTLAVACQHEHQFTKRNFDETNHWMECPEDGEVDESTRKPHNFVNGKCECGYQQKHTHNYSQWVKSDPAEHWKVCPDDGAIDESTRAAHNYTNGACECGRRNYAVSGVVTLYKHGTASAASNEGVTLALRDAEGLIPVTIQKGENGAFSFYADAGDYTIVASKNGYITKNVPVTVSAELEEGGALSGIPVGLEYNLMEPAGFNETQAFGNVNKGLDNSSTTLTANSTLCVRSANYYQNVAYTFYAVKKMSNCSWGDGSKHSVHHVFAEFEDGKHLVVRLHDNESSKTLSIITQDWDWLHAESNSLVEKEMFINYNHDFDADFIGDEGMAMSIVRKGASLIVMVEDEIVYSMVLDETHAAMGVKVGASNWDGAMGEYRFTLREDVENVLPDDVTVTLPDALDHGSVTLAESSYKIGDVVTLNVAADADYRFTELKIDGRNVLADVKDGKIKFVAVKDSYTVTAVITQVVKRTNVEIDISSANLFDRNESLDGQNVTLANVYGDEYTVKVQNGKISLDEIFAGEYTVTMAGYYSTAVTVPQDGAVSPVTVSYVAFGTAFGWDAAQHDYSHVNDANPYVTMRDNKTFNAQSTKTFNNVMATVYFRSKDVRDGDKVHGIVLKFDDGKHFAVRGYYDNGNYGVQLVRTTFWDNANWINYMGVGDTLIPDETNEWEIKVGDLNKYKDLIEGDTGVKLTLVLIDGRVIVMAQDEALYSYSLPEAYANKSARVAFYSTAAADNAQFRIAVETVKTEIEQALAATVTLPAAGDLIGGTITGDVADVKIGDVVTLTLTNDEGYKFMSIKVNGKDILGTLNDGKVTFIVPSETVAVTAEIIEYKDVEADVAIKGVRQGQDVSLNGVTVTLTGLYATYNIEIANDKLTKTVKNGTYTLTANGYYPCEVTVNSDGTVDPIALEYVMYENLLVGWSDFNNNDFSHINEAQPYVVVKSSTTFNMQTKDKFTGNVMGTLWADWNNMEEDQQFVTIMFNNGKQLLIRIQKWSNSTRIQIIRWHSGWDINTPITKSDSSLMIDYIDPSLDSWHNDDLSEREFDLQWNKTAHESKLTNGGLRVSIVRINNVLQVRIEDDIVYSVTLSEEYADMPVQFGFFSHRSKANVQIKALITEDIPDAVNVTRPAELQNGSLTLGKESYKIGEEVIINVAADQGYRFTALKIDGKDVLADVDNGVIKFTALKNNYNVEAVIEQIVELENVEITVSGHKNGENVALNGLVASLTNRLDSYPDLTVADGKITLPKVNAGEYTLTVQGYYSVKVTVGSDPIDAIVLEYQLLEVIGFDGENHDLSKQNEGELTVQKAVFDVATKDSYSGSIAASLYVKNNNVRAENQEQRIFIKFADGKHLVIAYYKDGDNEKIKIIDDLWTWDWNNNYAKFPASDALETAGDIHTLTDAEKALTAGDGLKLTIARDGKNLYILVNDSVVKTVVLADGYASAECRVGFLANDCLNADAESGVKGSVWTFALETDVEKYVPAE